MIKNLSCSFCGSSAVDVLKLVDSGKGPMICDACVDMAANIIGDDPKIRARRLQDMREYLVVVRKDQPDTVVFILNDYKKVGK